MRHVCRIWRNRLELLRKFVVLVYFTRTGFFLEKPGSLLPRRTETVGASVGRVGPAFRAVFRAASALGAAGGAVPAGTRTRDTHTLSHKTNLNKVRFFFLHERDFTNKFTRSRRIHPVLADHFLSFFPIPLKFGIFTVYHH